jgi:peptide/nickel transport system permease protein
MTTSIAEADILPPRLIRVKKGAKRPIGSVLAFGIPLVVIALLALISPWLPLPEPDAQNLAHAHEPPLLFGGSAAHPLGTDSLGRDMLARMLAGGRLTLLFGLGGMIVALIPGVLLGLLSGYFRGKTDVVISRLVEASLALPALLLAISLIASNGRSLLNLLLVLGLIGWATYARVVRSDVLSIRGRPWVLSLRSAGFSHSAILFRHVLPNAFGSILVVAALTVGEMIAAESALSFLGLGVVDPDISWGAMLADGRTEITTAWWAALLPGLAITVVIILVNLLADAIRSATEPRSVR